MHSTINSFKELWRESQFNSQHEITCQRNEQMESTKIIRHRDRRMVYNYSFVVVDGRCGVTVKDV